MSKLEQQKALPRRRPFKLKQIKGAAMYPHKCPDEYAEQFRAVDAAMTKAAKKVGKAKKAKKR